ncbi:MAG: glutamate-1-semialdehyde 2,1-aminomutase [Thaumarchaeota archaeon]|nr:glutamate-1-semialdehyde 2,1-aminomutase [Nitrososphaerota archaeon]
MQIEKSQALNKRAQRVLVGGVNSPVRSFRAVGGEPRLISKAKGPRMYDVDGNSYIDYVCSWGALIMGHADETVVKAIKEYSTRGTSYGASTELEIELAETVIKAFPSIKMLRLVNSGTEATMSAIRLARGFTNRSKILKFEGCYHGHADYFLAKAGSGLATYSLPNSAGVPESIVKDTIILPYNDTDKLGETFENFGEEIAAVIVEPVAGNMGVVQAKTDFLFMLRELTQRHGSLLIFDEVITGFRFAYGGAQALFGVTPDLTCLGKIIGGGLPVGAYGGRRDIMSKLAPLGPVYQAGTLSGNPLCMAAGLATLRQLNGRLYADLESRSKRLCDELKRIAEESQFPTVINRVGSMWSLFFTDKDRVENYFDASLNDRELYSRFFWKMMENGVYLPPSPFEAMFVSSAHDDSTIDDTVRAAESSFSKTGNAK